MKRIYHRYEKCEEYQAGMWRGTEPDDRAKYVASAAKLMCDPAGFLSAMLSAVDSWRYSCEQNLTAPTVNKQAWMGHAGCCIATGSPEDLTREAWGTLTQDQQDVANQMADQAIAAWMERHAKA